MRRTSKIQKTVEPPEFKVSLRKQAQGTTFPNIRTLDYLRYLTRKECMNAKLAQSPSRSHLRRMWYWYHRPDASADSYQICDYDYSFVSIFYCASLIHAFCILSSMSSLARHSKYQQLLLTSNQTVCRLIGLLSSTLAVVNCITSGTFRFVLWNE